MVEYCYLEVYKSDHRPNTTRYFLARHTWKGPKGELDPLFAHHTQKIPGYHIDTAIYIDDITEGGWESWLGYYRYAQEECLMNPKEDWEEPEIICKVVADGVQVWKGPLSELVCKYPEVDYDRARKAFKYRDYIKIKGYKIVCQRKKQESSLQ